MNKVAFLMIAALLLSMSAIAFAQEFPDVPPDHWAYDAVQELVDAGIIQGYPDGTFGGKRAMTRYEFAEAMAKAIPVIAEMVGDGGTGMQGPKGDPGPQGPPGPKGDSGGTVNQEQITAVQRMMDEFQDELASLGVQVESVRRDLNALSERVAAVEAEQERVRVTGVANIIGRGEVTNNGPVFDRDARLLADGQNPLANSSVFTDFGLGIAGKVSDDAVVDALLVTGDYTQWALDDNDDSQNDFTLWKLNLQTAMKLGPLGQGQVTVGRFPFQLTPLTLKFVDPDSYAYVDRLDDGNYVFDGGSIMFNWSRLALTAFAAKTDPIDDLITPALLDDNGTLIGQMAGLRAVIGTGFLGNLGLTYYQAGALDNALGGHLNVWGADLNTSFGSIGLAAEYAQTDPSNAINDVDDLIFGADADDDNSAWNAKLNFMLGNLGIGAGYGVVEQNYVAPGYWARLGTLVNPVNVKGYNADLTYALTSNIKLTAEGQFLEPESVIPANGVPGNLVAARAATFQGRDLAVPASELDKLENWKVGLQYGLTSRNTVDLGYEQTTVSPFAANSDLEERFISIGLGHTFNPNASMKLLYQIVEFEDKGDSDNNWRGGVATAQFGVKF